MPRRQIKDYRLSPAAQADLNSVWDYTADMWSPDQADSYLRDLNENLLILCDHPKMARERTEIHPPVRLHPCRSHLILYRIEEDHLFIIRIVHNRQHWQALLNE